MAKTHAVESEQSDAGPETTVEPETASRPSLRSDTRGISFTSGKKLLGLVIGISVAVLVAQAIFLPAINDYAGGNTDNLTGSQETVNSLIPIFGLLALALAFIMQATD